MKPTPLVAALALSTAVALTLPAHAQNSDLQGATPTTQQSAPSESGQADTPAVPQQSSSSANAPRQSTAERQPADTANAAQPPSEQQPSEQPSGESDTRNMGNAMSAQSKPGDQQMSRGRADTQESWRGRMRSGMMGRQRHGRRCHGMNAHSGMMGHPARMMMRYPEGALAFLKTELKIEDSQTRQWNAFAQAMRRDSLQMKQMRAERRHAGHAGDLQSWLKRREARAEARLQMVRSLSATLLPLYQSLDAQQKQTVDDLFLPCGGQPSGMNAPQQR